MFKIRYYFPCLAVLLLSGCQTINKKDLSIGDADFKVDVTHYQPTEKTEKTLLIFAPTGGTNFIDRSYAKTFYNKGYEVYILNSWTGDKEFRFDLDIHQVLYSRAQRAVSLVLDQVKSPFIGLLGTSLGGLHSAVSASKQDRLNAVFVITAGAPITEIIVTTDQQAMIDAKTKRFTMFGFKNEFEYMDALSKNFQLEPMKIGDGYKKKQLGMMIATQDTTVPTTYQRQLQKFWNPKVTLTYDNGHFWTIVKTWLYETDSLVNFFEDSFKQSQFQTGEK